MSNKLYLNDRVELHSVFADTSNMTLETFYKNNNALTCVISKDDINVPMLDTTTNPIEIVGVNQQSGKECRVTWTNFETTNEFTVTDIADWNYGYYKIFVRQYKTATNGTESKSTTSGMYHDLNKKPIYWNKSPLQFMTYIDSGSFEIGCPTDEYGNETGNVTQRNKITIAKPFFIQRTHITTNLFNKVFQAVDPTAYSTYDWTQKDVFNNIAKNHVCNKRYYDNGQFQWRSGSSWKVIWPSVANIETTTGKYNASYMQTGYLVNTTPMTQQSINECPTYMVNSIGKTADGGDNVYATRSFAEYFMGEGYTPNNVSSSLNNLGWSWYIPTEAQWEYACRAGTTTAFNNGVNLENRYPSTAGSDDKNILQRNIDEVAVWYNHIGDLTASAMFKPSKLGLYDMHGLLYEWVVDADHMNYNSISGSVYTPDGDINGTFAGSPCHKIVSTGTAGRGLRGGIYGSSYNWYARALRSAYRYWATPAYCSVIYGARLVLVQI